MATFEIAPIRRPFRAVVVCPADICTWETDADLDSGQPVRYLIDTNCPGDLHDAIDRAVDKVATDRALAIEAILRGHFESHDVMDWVRTIQSLEQQLAQYDCGIRPHMPRFWDVGAASALSAESDRFYPDLDAIDRWDDNAGQS
jgi:hypothetical protein